MLEALFSAKRKVKSDFQIALDFAGQVGSQVISNTGTGNASFIANGGMTITSLEKVFGETCLLNNGANNNYLRSTNAIPGGMFEKEFYIGFYAKSRGNNNDPYRGFLHLGTSANSANGITFINDGLYIANNAGTNWQVIPMQPAPSTAVFDHFAIAKRITATNDSYRLFRNGKVVGTLNLASRTFIPGDTSAQLEIGLNHSSGQSVNSYMANFRMAIGNHVHWEEFNPLEDYL